MRTQTLIFLVACAAKPRIHATDDALVETPKEEEQTAAAAQPTGGKRKVLVIGIDGLRQDALMQGNLPNLHALRDRGVWSINGKANDTTWSGPGWSTIFTGVWRDKHGVQENSYAGSRFDLYPDFFSRIEAARPDLRTLRISSWEGISDKTPSGADNKLVFHYENEGDETSVAAALQALQSNPPDVMFLYLVMVDVAGHAHGFHPSVPEYARALEHADAQVGQVLAALPSDDWLVIVTTDHGGTADGKHGRDIPEHRRIFFIASAAGVTPGEIPFFNQTDIAPTVLEHLGIARSPDFDGAPLPLTGFPSYPLIVNADAGLDAQHSGGMEGNVTGWREGYGVTPMNGAFYGYVNDTAAMAQQVELPQGTFTLTADLASTCGGAEPTLTLRKVDSTPLTAIRWPSGKTYYFTGNHYDATWPGLFADGVDAALDWGNGKVYFFRGDQYIRYDVAADRADDGYPARIADYWKGLERFSGGARDLDAAIRWPNGSVYFFKGNEYIKYNVTNDATERGYPRFISQETWPGLQAWPYGIDDVVALGGNYFMFYRRGEQIAYDAASDKGDAPVRSELWAEWLSETVEGPARAEIQVVFPPAGDGCDSFVDDVSLE